MLRREIELVKALNQKLEARLTRHRQAVRALKRKNETMRKMHGSFDLKRLIDDLLALALHVCDSENVSMIPIDDDADELDFVEVIGETRQQLLNHRIAIDTGSVGPVVQARTAVLASDEHNSPRWSSEVDQVFGFSTNALMCAPLFNNEKRVGLSR